MAITRKKQIEDTLVSVRVRGPHVGVAAHELDGDEERSIERRLTAKEAKKLRKELKQAIAAAEENANPFG